MEKLLKLSILKSSVGQSDNVLEKGALKRFIPADYAQQSYENNRKRSIKKSRLNKELKENILHYHNQKFSPEMMVKAKGVNVGIFTIYYWIHHGKLGLSKQDLLYPRKGKSVKNQASTNLNPPGQSNLSHSVLKLSICDWRMGIMRLIRFCLQE